MNFRRLQAALTVYIKINEPPVLKESMQPDDAAHVSRELLATLCSREVTVRLLSV